MQITFQLEISKNISQIWKKCMGLIRPIVGAVLAINPNYLENNVKNINKVVFVS